MTKHIHALHSGNYFVLIVESLITSNPKYVIWAGDYADETISREGSEEKVNYFNFMEYNSVPWLNQQLEVSLPKGHFLVNHTQQQYTVMTKYECIHPLPLLTSDRCNGRGSGDYRGSDEDMCGAWRGDLVSMEPASWSTAGYREVLYNFEE